MSQTPILCCLALCGCIASPKSAYRPPSPKAPAPEPFAQPGAFPYLLIFDVQSTDDGAGAPGVDVCLVIADCANAVAADARLGGGEPCREPGPGCVTDRTNPQAALSLPDHCRAENVPSDFVSLGTDGMIAIGFDADIAGCTLTVVTLGSRTRERWEAYACDRADPDEANCLKNGRPIIGDDGGDITFSIPMGSSPSGPLAR